MERDAPEPLLRLSGVTKRFGSAFALRDVSLDLREGEFVCLLGPSGCGKSTLLRCLAGFESLDGGTITFAGQDLTRVPPHRRPLNMMFQSYALFPHLSVAGNIAYGLAGLGLSRTERAARLAEMVRLARLEGLELRRPAQLSGGQRQRVALARALARRPRVLLLDEPLAALDRGLRASTGAELKEVQRRLGTTFVMVTHDQDEALALADRIGIMEGGELVQVGPPRDVYDRPASRFVARFLGAANVLAGTIVGRDAGRCRLGLPGGSFVEGETEAPLSPGQPAAAIIRPESIAIAPDTGEGGRGRLHGTVQEATFLGSVTDVKVALGCGEILRVTLSAPADPPAPGTPVTCAVAPAAVRILP